MIKQYLHKLFHLISKKTAILFSIFLIAAPIAALAQPAPGTQNTGAQFVNFANNLLRTANIIVTLLFVVALLVFAYGIIRYLLAAGDATDVAAARGYIIWGVVGMAVLASLFGLILFLRNVFGVQNDKGNLQAPNTTGSTITQGTVNGGGVGGVGGGIGGVGGGIAPPPPGPAGP